MKNKALRIRCTFKTTENRAELRHVSGQSSILLVRYRVLWVASLVLLLVLAGCGGGGPSPLPTNSISPVAPAVAVNGQVLLQVTVNGLCSTCSIPDIDWSIAEDGGTCNWITTPPTGPCPGGTLQLTGANPGISLTATYYAPSTPGTYHVDAGAILFKVKPAESIITVTP
jgi:hypothetical protein